MSKQLVYLTKTLSMASATMVGSFLAGFCGVSMAILLEFSPRAGIVGSFFLTSLNMGLIYNACSFQDNKDTDDSITLATQIVALVLGFAVPLFFWCLGARSAYMAFV